MLMRIERLNSTEKQARRITRARVVAAFRRLAHGVAARQAQGRAVAFYRSSGHAWAACLG
jgi:hypothetical protein